MGWHCSRVWNRGWRYHNRWTESKHCTHSHFSNRCSAHSTNSEYPWIKKFQRGDVPFCEVETRGRFEREASGSRGECCVRVSTSSSWCPSIVPRIFLHFHRTQFVPCISEDPAVQVVQFCRTANWLVPPVRGYLLTFIIGDSRYMCRCGKLIPVLGADFLTWCRFWSAFSDGSFISKCVSSFRSPKKLLLLWYSSNSCTLWPSQMTLVGAYVRRLVFLLSTQQKFWHSIGPGRQFLTRYIKANAPEKYHDVLIPTFRE